MKIGVQFNCQHDGLAACLRALLPDATVINFESTADLPETVQAQRAGALNACDHVVTSHIHARFGLLSAEALRRSARRCHILPSFTFAGYHPDMCYVYADGQILDSCTGGYHSRLAVSAYLAGMGVGDTVALYNRLVFSRLGYFAAFEEQAALLCASWARDGIDAWPLLRRWAAAGCFAYTLNHPKMIVLLDLARIACDRMGVTPAVTDIDPASLPDRLARGPMHPVFPDIAAALGIAPEGCFAAGSRHGPPVPITPRQFVSDSFGRYAGVPAEALRATPGVAEAMAALNLPVRVPPPRRLGPSMVLMTHHGTLLREGPLRGEVSHAALAVADWELAYLRLDCARLPSRPAVPGIEGAELALAPERRRVVIGRDGTFLCADPATGQAGFTRSMAADWEHFLPLREDEAALLCRLMSADWLVPDTHDVVARQDIGIEPGPVLRFGEARIDLARHFPAAAGTAIRLIVDDEPVELREHVPAAAPTSTIPEPGHSLGLVGAPVFAAPPMVAEAADIDWMRRSAVAALALDGAAQATQALLRRRAAPVSGTDAAGLMVRFCGPDPSRLAGWMEAAVRLHVLAAVAPGGAGFLVPQDVPEAALQAWRALGFDGLVFHRADPGEEADLLWLENASIAELPAAALSGCRARAGIPQSSDRKLFWQNGVLPEIGRVLAAQGFEGVDPSGLPVVAGAALPAQAAWIVGRTGHVPLVFCQPGTRILELCDRAGFVQDDWILSAKLGLRHAVLPCASAGGALVPEPDKLARLLALMAQEELGGPSRSPQTPRHS